MHRFLFFATLVSVLTFRAEAQQDAQFSYYMFNQLYYNPAYAGAENITRITALHRSQWAFYQTDFGDGGAPTSQVFGMREFIM